MGPVGCNRFDLAERPVSTAEALQDCDVFKIVDALADPFQPYGRHNRFAAKVSARIDQPALTGRSGLAAFDISHIVPSVAGRTDSPGVHRPIKQSRSARA